MANLRVLFVSGELIGADVCHRLKQEGCDVKLYIKDKSRKDCFDGMVKKTDDWKKELKWVGKDGLIVFDDVIFKKEADNLSRQGFTVFGGNQKGNELELNREFAQKIFKRYGMNVLESKDFKDSVSATRHIKKNKGKWVVKQNGHDGSLTYIGSLSDGSDAVSILKSFKNHGKKNKSLSTISLQKKVDGIEVAVARYFNGKHWVGPIFVSFEHKPLLDGDRGPLTAEMGTLAWHDSDENNKVYKETLAKLEPYLRSINYRGYIDINSIVNDHGVFPLEATTRFGSPTNHMQSNMYSFPWYKLLSAVARGEDFNFKHKKEYTIVVSIAIPPFPYKSISSDYYAKGFDISFKNEVTKEEWENIHFEEVSARKAGGVLRYFVAGSNGYIMFVTGTGSTVEEARKKAYAIVDKVVIPKMIYRSDIGLKYINSDERLLKKWGWL